MQKFMILLNGGYNPFVPHGRGGLGYRPMRQMIGGMIRDDEEGGGGGGETRLVSPYKPYRDVDAQLVPVSNQDLIDEAQKLINDINSHDDDIIEHNVQNEKEEKQLRKEIKKYENQRENSKRIEKAKFDEIILQIDKIYMDNNGGRGIAFEKWVVANSKLIITAMNKIREYDEKFSDTIFSPINKIKQYEDISDGKYKKIKTSMQNKSVADLFPIDLYGKSIIVECKYFIDNTSDLIYIQKSKIIGNNAGHIRYVKHNKRYKYYGMYCFNDKCRGWVKNDENETFSESGKEYYLIIVLNDGIYIKNLIIQGHDNLFDKFDDIKTDSGNSIYFINTDPEEGYRKVYNTKVVKIYSNQNYAEECLEFKKSELIRLPI